MRFSASDCEAIAAGDTSGVRTSEDGQVGVLIIGYLLISLLVITVVVAVSSVYIEHKKLLSAADGAALAAADAYSIDVSVGGSTTPLPALRDAGVEESVTGYLTATGATTRFEQLAIGPATGAPDGRTARVVLTAVVRPPIVNFLVPAGIPITAEAHARAQLVR